MRQERRGRGRTWLRPAVAAAVLVGVLVVTAAAWAAWPRDVLPPGVRVGGLDLGGRPEDEARRLLEAEARERLGRRIAVVLGEATVAVDPKQLRARPQIDLALRQARESRGPVGRVAARLGLADPVVVPLTFRLDPMRLDRTVGRLADVLDARPVPARVEVRDARAVAVPGRVGRRLDREGLRRALATLPARVETDVRTAPAVPDTAAARTARDRAQEVLDDPPVVTAGERRLQLRPADLAAALQVRPKGDAFTVALDPKVLAPQVRAAFATETRRPRNARFVVRGDRVGVARGILGREPDVPSLARRIVERPTARGFQLTFAAVRPDLTTREAQAMGIRELVGSFTTAYPCCAPRVQNIQRAAAILDGTIVRAGARFSLNEALGERTEERGFVEAPQIVQGRLVDAVGGGVSQVATTIYNAAFFAGLELVDHTPHQFYISRYPRGREATVSWGGPELIVRNDWSAALLMDVTATDTAVTVRLFSSRLGRRVTTSTGEPYGQREARTIEVTNPSLPPGSRVVEQDGGVPGFTIEYTRKVFQGSKLRRDERFKVRYDPEDTIIEVGPPRPAPKPPRPTPETPTPGGGTPPPPGEEPPGGEPPRQQPPGPPPTATAPTPTTTT